MVLAESGLFDTLLGLPQHPLVVHAVVVLLPLTALVEIAVALQPRWNRAWGVWVVVALFVLDEESPGIRPLGGAARWWLHHSLESLAASLGGIGVPLVLRSGPAAAEVRAVVEALDAGAVHWNRRYGGPERAVDAGL